MSGQESEEFASEIIEPLRAANDIVVTQSEMEKKTDNSNESDVNRRNENKENDNNKDSSKIERFKAKRDKKAPILPTMLDETHHGRKLAVPNQLGTSTPEARNTHALMNQANVATIIKTQDILIKKLNELAGQVNEFNEQTNKQNEEQAEKIENFENETSKGLDTITTEIAGIKVKNLLFVH